MNNDLISREALKKSMRKSINERYISWTKTITVADIATLIFDEIEYAPTVEPEQITIKCDTEEDKQKLLLALRNAKLKVLNEAEITQGEWIPVSERFPEDMQEVLVWFEYYRYGDYNCMYQTYGFCHVFDGKWSSFINGETGWRDARIIAWMPLPEPYKEEEK